MWAGSRETTDNSRSGLFILQKKKKKFIEQGDLKMLSTEEEEEMR